MFEREIRFIYDFNLNKVNKLGPFFTFEQLLKADLHPAILQYISAEIDYLIFEDRQKLLKNSLFDYSGEKISYHFNQISEEVKRTKRFALEYIAKLVLHASSFTVNYLIHPKWTLQKFVYDEDTTKTTIEIKQILNYVYYYKYLNKILVSYINSKKILSMNVQEFEELLNKADKLGVETYLSAILSNALKSMAEFLNIGEIKKNKIPLSAVEMFLEEKELSSHLQKVNEVFGKDENAKYTINDYERVFDNVVIVKEEIMPEVAEEKLEEQEYEVEEQPVEEQIESADEEQEIESSAEEETEILEEEEQKVLEDISNTERDESDEKQDQDYEQEQEITVSHTTKLRIHVDEDNRIEPVTEAENENTLSEENRSEGSEDTLETDTEEQVVNEITETKVNKDYEEEEDEADSLSFILKQKEIDETIPEEPIQSADDVSGVTDNIEQPVEQIDDEKEILNEQKYLSETDSKPIVDLAEILEHKEMTRIIEVIYDYDIEDFAKTLDEISSCKNFNEALLVINQTLTSRRINRNSKEAEAFREIIAEYFSKQ